MATRTKGKHFNVNEKQYKIGEFSSRLRLARFSDKKGG